jgi:putative Mg2+ transporter-C (MgtC) family protein
VVLDPQIVVLRVALAFVFGAIAGVEREWRHKVAGIKTNALVAIGAAAFALMSDTFGPGNHNPAQLAAAVVTGIGFIGAGVIIHRGATVQGVTTAATLWANASMGVALGLGHLVVGATVFVGVILVQFVLPPIAAFITAHGPRDRDR